MEEKLSLSKIRKNLKKDASSFPKLKIAVLGDTATQFLSMAIRGIGYDVNYNIELFEADYNQIQRQVFDKTSELYQFEADYTVIFQSTHKLLSFYNKLSFEKKETCADERLAEIKQFLNCISGKIIYFNYPEIDDSVYGQYASKVESSFLFQLRKLNYELMNFSNEQQRFLLADLSSLQNRNGRNWLFDPSIYINTEMVLSVEAVPYVGKLVLDIINACQGYFKKCLILDLDNTLWGGIIGDDGLERIQLGHGLGIGKAFTEFQQWILKLKERGIILAVCSKNDKEVAELPFKEHPEMLITLNDIAVFVANWGNKADNIRHIQQILNIGFDSMVFLDDNPFERNLVKENIPAICVPDLPEDPSDYLEYLYALNLFETASYSINDKNRTRQYKEQAERAVLKEQSTNENEFLRNLEMISVVEDFNNFNTPRVAQLSQRSNQFNLRTIRYNEQEIKDIAESEKFKSFAFSLSDKFGDNGLICVIILEKDDSTKSLFINTWFMSCRVLKRGMENFVLNEIVSYAFQNGYKKIFSEYIPTLKNKMVREHYDSLGFKKIAEDKERNSVSYQLDVDAYCPKECFIVKKIV